jgi:hypothetical protein
VRSVGPGTKAIADVVGLMIAMPPKDPSVL